MLCVQIEASPRWDLGELQWLRMEVTWGPRVAFGSPSPLPLSLTLGFEQAPWVSSVQLPGTGQAGAVKCCATDLEDTGQHSHLLRL